jgi:hypothetical protein
MHDAGRIEGMKSLAHMLQDQHSRLVVDGGNDVAKTIARWPEAVVTAVSGCARSS